jgi:hypothetical protein
MKHIVLLAILLIAPLAACGEVVITKPQNATPAQVSQNTPYTPSPILYLECGNSRDTVLAVRMLTLAQLNDPDRAVRFTKGLPRTCRAGNVTSAGYVQNVYSVSTRDGWTVQVVDWIQSNGFPITFVETSRAQLGHIKRRSYDQAVPRRHDDVRRPPKRDRPIQELRHLDVDKGQELLRRQLGLPPKR